MAAVQLSKKRTLEESNGNHDNSKRSNVGSDMPMLKFLIPNFMAGKLIGKGGTNIGDLQSKFNANIQISPNKEFYPGTTERILTVSADIDHIVEFCNYIISEIDDDDKPDKSPNVKQEIKLVFSNVAAGLVIGKGGATIKAIQTESNGSWINISKKEESITGERVLVVTGDKEQCTAACKQVIENMSTVGDKMSNSNLRYNNFNNGMSMPQNNMPVHLENSNFMYNAANGNGIGNLNGNGNSHYQAKSGIKAKFQVEMEVPDKMVGNVLGKQGQSISEVIHNSGAKLQFSAKEEFVPGTTNRVLTITGGMYQVQNAYMLVDNKLAQLEHEFK